MHEAALRIVPAHQRFDADDAAGGEADLRLVMQHELPLGDGAAQARLERQPLHGAALHVVRAELVRVAARFLGAVHRAVGVAQQRLRVGAVVGIERDADAGGDFDRRPGDRQRLLDRAAHFLGDVDRVLGLAQLGEDDRELVAAEARHGVVLADVGAEARAPSPAAARRPARGRACR